MSDYHIPPEVEAAIVTVVSDDYLEDAQLMEEIVIMNAWLSLEGDDDEEE